MLGLKLIHVSNKKEPQEIKTWNGYTAVPEK